MSAYIVSVRYGLMREMTNFVTSIADLKPGDHVILRTDRGTDHGHVATPSQEVDHDPRGLGEVVRLATEGDETILNHIRQTRQPEEHSYCVTCIKERKLPMKLVGTEHLFGGEKILFYFLADGRVDFRELVKDLARRYRTRIEMRQIGVRDEARVLSDYEHCGQELCCRTFMRNLEPVTMRMAKTQKSTLDPNKISGHCGRLMCCLRFEDEVYSEHKRELPNRNDTVHLDGVVGRVLYTKILSREVTVQLEGGDRVTVNVDALTLQKGRPRKAPPCQTKDGNCKDGACGGGCAAHGAASGRDNASTDENARSKHRRPRKPDHASGASPNRPSGASPQTPDTSS